MQIALDSLGPYLNRMSDGETGDRHLWLTAAMDKFRANPDVEILQDGGWTGYDDVARWGVREGVRLDPQNIRLPYLNAFENSFPSFRVLRQKYDRDELRFQVGIPMPLDLAVNTFGIEAISDDSIIGPCTEATLRELDKIFDQGGDEVVFQIEV